MARGGRYWTKRTGLTQRLFLIGNDPFRRRQNRARHRSPRVQCLRKRVEQQQYDASTRHGLTQGTGSGAGRSLPANN